MVTPRRLRRPEPKRRYDDDFVQRPISTQPRRVTLLKTKTTNQWWRKFAHDPSS